MISQCTVICNGINGILEVTCCSFHKRRFDAKFLHLFLFLTLAWQTSSSCWVRHFSIGIIFTSVFNLTSIFIRLKSYLVTLSFHEIRIWNNKIVGNIKFKKSLYFLVTSSKSFTNMSAILPICILSNVTIEISTNKQDLSFFNVSRFS